MIVWHQIGLIFAVESISGGLRPQFLSSCQDFFEAGGVSKTDANIEALLLRCEI